MVTINKLFKAVCLLLCLTMCLHITTFAEESTVATEIYTEADAGEILIKSDELFDAIEDEYAKLEDDINSNKTELDNINSNINSNIQRLAVINSDVDILNNQIRLLDTELSSLSSFLKLVDDVTAELSEEIDALTTSIKETEKRMEDIKPELESVSKDVQKLIRTEYMEGEPSYIEIVLSADSLADYYSRKELFDRLKEEKAAKFNKVSSLNKELSLSKKAMEQKKKDLENDKIILAKFQDKYNESIKRQEIAQNDLINKKNEVTQRKNEVKDIISELDTESEVYKQQIKRDRAEMEYLSAYVDSFISEYGSKLNDIPNIEFTNEHMIWPVNFSSYLTATYPAYSDGTPHWGIDICAKDGNSYGKPFNAAQSGTVILAVNDNNYNSGFGNYCVVDHGDGTSTLYAHAKNLVVNKGEVVRQGETLGYIGSTGNSTGAHLHFEVRVKNNDGTIKRVNPLNYVQNT